MDDFFTCCKCQIHKDGSQKSGKKSGGSKSNCICIFCADGSMYASKYSRYDPSIKQNRIEATASGANVYWTGNECINGHLAHRYISGQCVKCSIISAKKRKIKSFTASDADISAKKSLDSLLHERELARELKDIYQ
jgi:hypothetical protein